MTDINDNELEVEQPETVEDAPTAEELGIEEPEVPADEPAQETVDESAQESEAPQADEVGEEPAGEPTEEVSEETPVDATSAEEPVDEPVEETVEPVEEEADEPVEETSEEETEEPAEDAVEETATDKVRGKKSKKPLTPAQKKKRTIKALIITGAIVLVFAIFFSSCAIANAVDVKALLKRGDNTEAIDYAGNQLVPEWEDGVDGNWYWTFKTDDEFKIVQLTDVHIGGGSFAVTHDEWAMAAVETMLREEKPDLVVVTGDIAYPVPFQVGTFNNLNAAKIFSNLMENLGVYWTFAYGNHDTEAYGTHTREQISKYYQSKTGHDEDGHPTGALKHCLYNEGVNAKDSFDPEDNTMGYGNCVIKIKNAAGTKVRQAVVVLDSHSYIDGDVMGMQWKYDSIHQSQIDWYTAEMEKIKTFNGGEYAKSQLFFHIPTYEFRSAWAEHLEGDKEGFVSLDDTKTAGTLHSGIVGEKDKPRHNERTYGVFCGMHKESLFEEGVTVGLAGIYCGHDHLNNFSIDYTDNATGVTVRLTYGMSIDYTAYPGIYKQHAQRGCTVITIDESNGFEVTPKNYYRDYGVGYEAKGDIVE